ncbi:hypothetical protein Cgig2_008836 [Carnegiea gigantea]|uniref:Uncharacterized protein n=1 Tax=Carnegiea gigantea TaxID=171969 RepID=A0A9Q1JUZ9_9CARY|nr:hypothetical protein Cgig2_008836 [Carnegiea gigantea]
MHSRNSPNAPKNTAQASSEKTITNIHQQPSAETDDTVEDTTYKIPPPRHVDESESDDEVLVKRIKKVKQGTKSRPKKMQLRAKIIKHKKEQKSLKKKQLIQKSVAVPVEGPKSMQSVPKPSIKNVIIRVTELPGNLCKWLVDRFDPYSVTLYISTDKRIEIIQMDVHITLVLPIGVRKVEEFYEKKPKDAKYNEVLDACSKDWNLQDGTPKLSQMP